MYLAGLQKTTLLDYPGKVACTVFTPGCNFRCGFCHNASLVLRPGEGGALSQEEFFAFLRKRTGILDGVCVTGGEPLLHPELPGLLREIRALGFCVKLDTNGSKPEALRALLEENLVDYVAMDIKNTPERYAATVGRNDLCFSHIQASMALLMEGTTDYEFRTTVARGLHDEAAIRAMSAWLKDAKRWFLQAFVDSGDLIDPAITGFGEEEMLALLAAARENCPQAQLRGL